MGSNHMAADARAYMDARPLLLYCLHLLYAIRHQISAVVSLGLQTLHQVLLLDEHRDLTRLC